MHSREQNKFEFIEAKEEETRETPGPKNTEKV